MQTKQCAKCGVAHPIKQFKFKSTLAQAKAWGRTGNIRVMLESKYCQKCRPKRKSLVKLSTKDIHNRVHSGDLHPYMAKHVLESKERKERHKQAVAARQRWVKLWKAELKQTLAPLTQEVISARNAWRYARDKRPPQMRKAEFYFEYAGMLERAKASAQYDFLTNPRRPRTSWSDYIEPEVFIKVREMWAVVAEAYTHSRVPLLIKHRESVENSPQNMKEKVK
jgi:hypothetical protein